MRKPLLLIIYLALGCSLSPSARAAEESLIDIRPGAVIRTTQAVDLDIPPMLRPVLSSDIAFVIVGGRAVPLFMAQPTQEAACLVADRTLALKDPSAVHLTQGTEFLIRSVQLEKKPNPLFAGPATVLEVEAAASAGMTLKGKFRCYPGKPGKKPISLEAFENVFNHKIRVDLEPGPR